MKNLGLGMLLMITIVCGCSTDMNFALLSKKLYRKNGDENDKSTFKLSSYKKDARIKSFLLDSSDFLKKQLKDTLYILEGYNIETATLYERIWNANHQISYSYLRGAVTPQKQSVFTDYQVKLITQWDTVQIRKEEKINGNWLDNNLLINGIRCYKFGGSWKIDVIAFKNFFNSKRDNSNIENNESGHRQPNH